MQQIISIIVAMNINNIIGVDNQLPWHIPEDLRHFKMLTLGKPVIMGRKTFQSIGRALSNRQNIIITRSKDFVASDVTVVASLDEALLLCTKQPEICIIGGGEVFRLALNLANQLHVTIVDIEVPRPTVLFPQIDYKNWQLVAQKDIISESGIVCHFKDYVRIGA